VTPEEMARLIEADVDRVMRAYHGSVERACEVALAGGVCGVSVTDYTATVDPDVPYGQVHYHPPAFTPVDWPPA
jgi:hypothetical protein